MTNNADDRAPAAKAIALVSQITTISLMMVIPAILGYFVDQWLNTVAVFTVVGLVFGVAAAVQQMIRLVKSMNKSNPKPPSD